MHLNIAEYKAVQMELLGSFACVIDDRIVPLTPMAQRLVILLTLRGPTARSTLERLLWPETEPSQAAKRLRQSLWRTRQATGDALLDTHGDRLRLRSQITVDLAVASSLAEKLARVTPAQEGAARDVMAAQNLNFLELELLPGWDGGDIKQVRERWNLVRLIALQRLAELHLAAKDPLSALDFARRAVDVDAYNERSHRITARAHLELGDVYGARKIYASYSELLRLELGASPTPEFRHIVMANASELF